MGQRVHNPRLGVCGVMTLVLISLISLTPAVLAGFDAQTAWQVDRQRGDQRLARYFALQVATIEQDCLSELSTVEDWQERRTIYRQQLLEMLGIGQNRPRTPLRSQVIGTTRRDNVEVERIHFQSSPGLYVTGNVYRPAPKAGEENIRRPAVLYVCGHGRVVQNGVSYGNKVYYQHHGVWFAKHGYVCLVIDTVQLGEIPGVHHGTYRHDRWWWNSRGYTPAGVEAWNSQRAIDYLTLRDDVDPQRIGVTGRSGGGIYSWWLAAMDERVAVAVPVAGVTSLWNQVVDGCVEGHCDCMFHVNTQRWDFPQITALVAPRPLLISNTDKDSIFPLTGVIDVHTKTRRIYQLLGANEKLGLHITEGAHKDTQELRIHAFRWFNRFLKQDDTLITQAAEPLFEPAELKVFSELPNDEINSTVDETFVPLAHPELPTDQADWDRQITRWTAELRDKCFRGWTHPTQPRLREPSVTSDQASGRWLVYTMVSEPSVELPLYVWLPNGKTLEACETIRLKVLGENEWGKFVEAAKTAPAEKDTAQAWLAPRGIGPTAWSDDSRDHTHIRRRFMLVGQTLDGMRVWDVRRALQSLRELLGDDARIHIDATGEMAGVSLYASLFETNVRQIDLRNLAQSHREGPIFLNVLRVLDVPQAVAMAATKSRVRIWESQHDWAYPKKVAQLVSWPADRLRIETTR